MSADGDVDSLLTEKLLDGHGAIPWVALDRFNMSKLCED
jgi:hypothetical protein